MLALSAMHDLRVLELFVRDLLVRHHVLSHSHCAAGCQPLVLLGVVHVYAKNWACFKLHLNSFRVTFLVRDHAFRHATMTPTPHNYNLSI